jgi:hypothetical protein
MRDPPDESERAPFHTARIFQLNNAYTRLLELKPQLHRFSWGELFIGHEEKALYDQAHPNKDFGSSLWGDMILYYMSQIQS